MNNLELFQNRFNNYVLAPLLENIEKFKDRNAFCINGNYFSYKDFGENISKIRSSIQSSKFSSCNVGLVVNDDIETYASIFALWLEGKTYVPFNPQQPFERNEEIIKQLGLKLILDSSKQSSFTKCYVILTSILNDTAYNLTPDSTVSDGNLSYIFFTSGSTGKPKGVAISRYNVASFISAFWDLGYQIDENDKCLQSFNLTFDLSVMSYLVPLLKGACLYTIPYDSIKYMYISELLEDHELTVALMVPSTIRNLRPYFDELTIPSLRYSLFCGEALHLDLIKEWSKCVPNAEIDNVYGPTENTIFCSFYRYKRNEINKTHNGVLSIGKSMNSGVMIITDEQYNELGIGKTGELCLAGSQLSPGYWEDPVKNSEMFFKNEQGILFYKTGDACFMDEDGDFMFVDRMDYQVKIQGYRVELGEIEYHAREYLHGRNTIAFTFENKTGNTEIALFVEGALGCTKPLIDYLKSKLPNYMIPARIIAQDIFLLNTSGKVDRNILKNLLK